MASPPLNPGKLFQIGFGCFESQLLLTGVKLQLFTKLAASPKGMTAVELANAVSIRSDGRAYLDFFDALAGLHLLHREGEGATALYTNSPESQAFLNKNAHSYVGGLFEMIHSRLYRFWADLDQALITGKPQNEVKITGKPLFDVMVNMPEVLAEFVNSMEHVNGANFVGLAAKFPFSNYKSLVDIGGCSGLLCRTVAAAHSTIQLTTYDLPQVSAIAKANNEKLGLGSRIGIHVGDMFTESFPKADLITMGNILHDWSLEKKKILIKKAFDALNPGGAFIVVEALIDDKRTDLMGLTLSLIMLIETGGGEGFNFTFQEFEGWTKDCGFARSEKLQIAPPNKFVAIAYKA